MMVVHGDDGSTVIMMDIMTMAVIMTMLMMNKGFIDIHRAHITHISWHFTNNLENEIE